MTKIKLNTIQESKSQIRNYKYSHFNPLRIIFAGSKNLLKNVPVDKVKEFERKYIDFLNTKHKKIMETIKSGKLTDEVIEVLTKTAEELSSTY